MNYRNILLTAAILCGAETQAQDVTIAFDLSQSGKRFTPTWGLDQAWISEQNMRKGINHMGIENVKIGRSTFRMTKALNDDGSLQADQIEKMTERNRILSIASPTLPVVFTADQEAGTDASYLTGGKANVAQWAAMIYAHVDWMAHNSQHPVVGVSPFNEPDYWSKEEGATPANHYEVAKRLKNQYASTFQNIDRVGGNTLNNDKALTWFNAGKDIYTWGNTHQLAGSFDNYARYYTELANMGKVGYNDEMHNVGEAMIGLEYGMTYGIWWGFDSRARGEFCRISAAGERIAYAEHRSNWTAASVYRSDDGQVKAFVGSSERQALTTDYQFVSLDRPVFFDCYGPLQHFNYTIPGGTAYQTGQTNAERVINIYYGEDVPRVAIDGGDYRIVCRASGAVLTYLNNLIITTKYKNSTAATHHWHLEWADNRTGGDLSFYFINLKDKPKLHINVRDFNTQDGAEVIAYDQNEIPHSNEQWYLEYAGNGYYYIRNRETALYLTSLSNNTSNAKVNTRVLLDGTDRYRQMWRLLPAETTYDTNAPAIPTALTAESRVASVALEWEAVTNPDFDSYTIVRAKADTDEWNVIARGITTNSYVDNTAQPGAIYKYKVRAMDHAQNLSEPSAEVTAGTNGRKALVARLLLEEGTDDASDNANNGTTEGEQLSFADADRGHKAAQLTRNNFIRLPYAATCHDELTVAMWVNLQDAGTAWQRLFDFGYDTDHYIFLTPSNGTTMRLAIKNGTTEQTLDCPSKLAPNTWKHVAVTLGRSEATIYVDGKEVARTTAFTSTAADIKPVLNYIGHSQFAADPNIKAQIRDLQIYNYVLNASEVAQVMEGNTVMSIADTAIDATGSTHSAVYTIDGRKRQATTNGINIINGKKVILH